MPLLHFRNEFSCSMKENEMFLFNNQQAIFRCSVFHFLHPNAVEIVFLSLWWLKIFKISIQKGTNWHSCVTPSLRPLMNMNQTFKLTWHGWPLRMDSMVGQRRGRQETFRIKEHIKRKNNCVLVWACLLLVTPLWRPQWQAPQAQRRLHLWFGLNLRLGRI